LIITLFYFNWSISIYWYAEIIDNNMFNGGTFGFEGSILSIIFLLFAIVGIELYFTKKLATKKKHSAFIR